MAPSPAGKQVALVLGAAGCRECHSAQGAASDSRLVFPGPGAPPAEVDRAAAALWELIDPASPARSRLVRKPTKALAHEGGQRITPGSADEQSLIAWIGEVSGQAAGLPTDEAARLSELGAARRAPLRELLHAALSPANAELSWPARFAPAEGNTPFRRLSRDELVATFAALTGAAPRRSDLPEDPRPGHGMLRTAGVSLLANEVLTLEQAVKLFLAKRAPEVVARPFAASACGVGDGLDADVVDKKNPAPMRACLGRWFTAFAEQAFRRAPTAEERAGLLALFDRAGEDHDEDMAAAEAAFSAIFLSPSFLYRAEAGTPVPGKPSLRALDAEEVATRLSYLGTLGPPDGTLLGAARAGRLGDPAERVRQLDRLFTTDAGKHALAVFVLEWLGANEDKIGLKAFRYQRDLGNDVEAAVHASAEATVRRVLEAGKPATVAELLSTTAYLDDPIIRKITTPPAKASGRKPAGGDTPETRRMGLLMHPQVLAAHTKEDGASPFQIGAFLREALLCEAVPPPPPNAAASARDDVPAGLSMRENLEFRTSAGRVCTGCHRTFSGLGYAFLPFDPVGRWLPADPGGKSWDLTGSVATSMGKTLTFGSTSELMGALASNPQVHGCFAQAALEWTFGRALQSRDHELVAAVDQVTRKTHGDLAAIFRAIVAAPAFVHVHASATP
jgi:hypothetical protein